MVVLKEFLYVDVDRVRSLLAQMDRGVLEAVKSSRADELKGGAKASAFGIGASGDYGRSSTHEESRSQQDLTFVTFERMADEEGIITELSADVMDAAKWQSGEIHSMFEQGEILRMETTVQLLDGGFFNQRIRRFTELAEAIVDMSGQTPSCRRTQQRR